MESLPFETIVYISSCLPKSDKLECIRVCEKWYDTITKTSLYKELEFCQQETFNEAQSYFRRHPEIGETVHTLEFPKGSNVNIARTSLIPEIFPKIRSFINRAHSFTPKKRPSPRSGSSSGTTWHSLEYLQDHSQNLNICNSILQDGGLHQLKVLVIGFPDFAGKSIHTSIKTLINNIKHIPSLECLVMYNGYIHLTDIERLHKNTPNLRELEFDRVRSENNGPMEKQLLLRSIEPVSRLRKLHWKQYGTESDFHIDASKIEVLQHLIRLFTYFSQKYINLEDLLVQPLIVLHGLIMPDIMVHPLTQLVTSFPHLKKYSMDTFLLTRKIVRAIDASGIRLKSLTIHIWTINEMKEQFEAVQKSNQVKGINELIIVKYPHWSRSPPPDLRSYVFELCNSLPQLRNLTIRNMEADAQELFLSLFGQFQKLETLNFRGIHFGPYNGGDHTRFYENSKAKSRLKHLKVTIASDLNAEYPIEEVSKTLNYALESCPDLESFEMFGELQLLESATIYLDFTKNRTLKDVNICFYKGQFCVCSKIHPGKSPGQRNGRKKGECNIHILCSNAVSLKLTRNEDCFHGLI
jgi:hypothetical protein